MPDAMNTPTSSAMSGVISRRASATANSAAATANWMKTSIFLTSFFSKKLSGSKPFTSPAMRAENCDASKWVMGPMPLRPSQSASQVALVPMPTDEMRPTPVRTTRLLKPPPSARSLLLRVALDVLDGFLHSRDLLGILVGNLDAELLLERHDELDGVERVGAEVVDKGCIRRHFVFIHAELLDDDLLDLIRNRHSVLPGHRAGAASPHPAWTSLHVHAAVHRQHVPRNICCLRGRQERDGRRHVLRGAETAQRNAGRPAAFRRGRQRARHIGVDEPRRHRVHRDVP